MAMTLVSTVTLSSSAAAMEFTNIPQTGKDIVVVLSARDASGSSATRNLLWTVNNSSSGYSFRNLWGSGSATGSQNSTSLGVSGSIFTTNPAAIIPGPGATSSTFSNVSIYVSNYASSANKSFSLDGVGENNNTAAYQGLMAGLWSNSAAITSFKLEADGTFATNSTASLYIIS